jgi:hypothetical protein
MVIVKTRATVENWYVYHSALGAGSYLRLNATAATASSTTLWNNTAPTSTVFSLGTDWAGLGTAVAYCFAEVAGYSKFGSYTGNGSADGAFVYTGFRPAYILIKRSSSSGTYWNIYDTTRSTFNLTDDVLYANLADAEAANEPSLGLDILSNGFKMRTTGSSINENGGTFIYACFAQNPFKYSLAR